MSSKAAHFCNFILSASPISRCFPQAALRKSMLLLVIRPVFCFYRIVGIPLASEERVIESATYIQGTERPVGGMKVPIKVLVVEDSRDDAELLLHALRHAGYQPTYALVQNAASMKAQL